MQVADGKSLLLVGGNINIDGGGIQAYGGNVELAGLAAPGNVGLNIAGDNLGLVIPENVERADVSLSNGAEVNVRGAGGGNIKIQARNVNLAGQSKLKAGIDIGLGTPNSKGGDITINATGDTTLIDKSFIANVVQEGAFGNAGDINITTGTLTLRDGGGINASLYGQGNAGNVNINTQGAVTVAGQKDDLNSGIGSFVFTGATGDGGNINIKSRSFTLSNDAYLNTDILGQGNAGNIQITTGTLKATNGGHIHSSILGKGNAGNISINTLDNIVFDTKSDVSSNVLNDGVGNGGNISLKTGSLSLTNGSQVSTNVSGQGNAGNITINARDTVKIDGVVKGGTFGLDKIAISNLSSSLGSGEGKGGDIEITAGSLSVTNGAFISGDTDGQGNGGNITINAGDTVTLDGGKNGLLTYVGTVPVDNSTGNAGNIRINARELFLKNGGELSAFSSGQGNGGNIFIDTRDAVTFDGTNAKNSLTGAYTFALGSGNGENIQVKTGTLTLKNGSVIRTSANRNAGNINIDTRDAVIIDGISGAFSFLSAGGVGKGGDIQITTDSLKLSNGGQLVATSYGKGNAGDIIVNADDAIGIDGVGSNGRSSGVFTTLEGEAEGRGGNINLTTDSLFLNRGGISSSSLGQGKAGDININSASTTIDNKGLIAAITNSGDGGNINLTVDDLLLLRHGGGISTTAGTAQSGGNGGNININSKFIVAIPEENSDISANAYTGTGGNVNINSQGIFGIEARPKPTEKSDITASSELGVAGVINIIQPDTSFIQNSFTELSPVIDTNALIANSCISRGTKRQENSFTITGSGALTNNRPDNVLVSNYTTGEVRGVEITSRPWKKGDPIIEPQGLYRLNNGQLLLSRECSN